MKIYISGNNQSGYKALRISNILDELKSFGLKVIVEQESEEDTLRPLIKDAILEVTGLEFEQYTDSSRSRLGYFARLIYARQCARLMIVTTADIAAEIKRSESNVQKYERKYQNEHGYNKAFRAIANRVNEIMNKYQCNT